MWLLLAVYLIFTAALTAANCDGGTTRKIDAISSSCSHNDRQTFFYWPGPGQSFKIDLDDDNKVTSSGALVGKLIADGDDDDCIDEIKSYYAFGTPAGGLITHTDTLWKFEMNSDIAKTAVMYVDLELEKNGKVIYINLVVVAPSEQG